MNESNFTLNLDGVEAADSQFKERLVPGIHEVIITGIGYKENEKTDAKSIVINMVNFAKTRELRDNFYIHTEGSLQATRERIKHLIKKTVGEQHATGALDEDALNKLLAGKQVRIKVVGEEYLHEGKVGVRTSLAYKGFAESISIPASETGLKHDPANKWDYKRLEADELPPTDMTLEKGAGDDLPF